jgi:hypothetical protein
MWIVFAGLRAASRRPGSQRQGPPKPWPVLGRLVFAFFFFATMIAMGGGAKTAAIVIFVLIGVSAALALVCASAHAIVHRDDKPATPADPLAEFFTDKEGSKR